MAIVESQRVDGEREGPVRLSDSRPVPFIMASDGMTLEGHGATRVVSESVAGNLLSEAATALAGAPPGSLLVGALPFDRHALAHLVVPERISYLPVLPCSPLSPHRQELARHTDWSVVESPTCGEYAENVRRALTLIEPGAAAPAQCLKKIVLARTLEVTRDRPIDPLHVFASLLCDHRSTAFCVPLPPGPGGVARTLVGASPELLIEKRGRTLASLPMAGSAARVADAAADRALADDLSHSAKDLREHRMVVEWVLDILAPHCRRLRASDQPVLAATPTMWHLATPIEGELRGEVSSLALAAALHPTPAVCGTPCAQANRLLCELEPFDRRFFAGALGWCNGEGDGRWLVTIRCAEISGQTATLYAGAGIVDGSDPEAESAETAAKFRTLLRALGIDRRGRPVAPVTA